MYLRAHITLLSSGAIVYTEEVQLDITVSNPCLLIGSNILANAITDIEYWIGDGVQAWTLGAGYWDDAWS